MSESLQYFYGWPHGHTSPTATGRPTATALLADSRSVEDRLDIDRQHGYIATGAVIVGDVKELGDAAMAAAISKLHESCTVHNYDVRMAVEMLARNESLTGSCLQSVFLGPEGSFTNAAERSKLFRFDFAVHKIANALYCFS